MDRLPSSTWEHLQNIQGGSHLDTHTCNFYAIVGSDKERIKKYTGISLGISLAICPEGEGEGLYCCLHYIVPSQIQKKWILEGHKPLLISQVLFISKLLFSNVVCLLSVQNEKGHYVCNENIT